VKRPDDTYPQRLGKGMAAIASILALAMLTWFFSGALERQHNPNRSVAASSTSGGVQEVVLERNRLGHYVVTGRINGQPVDFLLDTGATSLSIPQPIAQRLGLARGAPATVRTANGTVTVYATRIDSIDIGGIALRNVRAHINPHYRANEVLLGMSFLKHVDFSQEGNRLTLRQRAQ
jgi:aspartyl protease family protein